MARIQGSVFKHLRLHSIKMHLDARKKYRMLKVGKLVRESLTIENEEKIDYAVRHQQWL